MSGADIETLSNRWICHSCVGEAYLSEEMERTGENHACSYCDDTARAFQLGNVAERVAAAFEDHYFRTSDQPDSFQQMLLSDRESTYEWYREGEPVIEAIAGAAHVSEEVARDIQLILEDEHGDIEKDQLGEEAEFSRDSQYEPKGPDSWMWHLNWRLFEHSLKTEARLFNQTGVQHLNSLFEGLEGLRTRNGQSLIVKAGPGTSIASIYRARVFQSEEKLREAMCWPDSELGPPISRLALAGRMNAMGISVFYGAKEPVVALAEVRAPVGSRVAVARFEILRELRLLDLNAMQAVHSEGSIFDSTFARRLEREAFLRSLTSRITKPVMPDDEAFEYLVTQAIADYLATSHSLLLDGIIYPSVQVEGESPNIALFNKAARVSAIELPNGTDVEADTSRSSDEGPEPDYSVVEWVPPPEKANTARNPKESHFHFPSAHPMDRDSTEDDRPHTLRVDPASVVVHLVRRVNFVTEAYEVDRRRIERRESGF